MRYDEEQILKAFAIYSELAQKGSVSGDFARTYKIDADVNALVEHFVGKMDAVCVLVGDTVYLVPTTRLSPFHESNDTLKKKYLPSKATNVDLYLMYLCTIVLLGSFYDSYQTMKPTRDFITLEEWLHSVNERMDSLRAHDEEKLMQMEKEFSYRWTALIEKWDALDDVKETATKQSGNTMSRLSFIDTTKRFLEKEEIIIQTGVNEFSLTAKTMEIVGHYFMDREYNRGILSFLYSFEKQEEDEYANNQ